jgi:hypothetical protein
MELRLWRSFPSQTARSAVSFSTTGIFPHLIFALDTAHAFIPTLTLSLCTSRMQSRVKACLEMVQSVQDLKTALFSLDLAIQKQDWEAATRCVQRARAIDAEVVESGFAEAVVVRFLLARGRRRREEAYH